jgi:hypothetical protein
MQELFCAVNSGAKACFLLLLTMNTIALQALYHELNATYFDSLLPPCRILWSRQLTRTAGNIDVRRAIIKLSVPLLVDAFRRDSLFPCEYSVCGVQCDSAEIATREILKHEMIHLWLHVQGLPSGHTAEFRAKPERWPAAHAPRHRLARTTQRLDLFLRAVRRRIHTPPRYGRSVACSACCKKHNGGKYDERYKLRGRRIAA